jgi:hypothetical protein
MSTVNLSLPDSLKAFVDEQVSQRGKERGRQRVRARTAPPSSTPKAEFERFSRPGANVINKLALQRQFFCSGTT